MASDNPAFSSEEPASQTEIYIIGQPQNNKASNSVGQHESSKENQKDDSWWMGWYRQLGVQLGLANTAFTRAVGFLILTGLGLLMPRLLVGVKAPPALILPPLAWLAGRMSTAVGLPTTTVQLLLGLLFRAVGWFEITADWRRVIFIIRYVAVAVVLLKGGLAVYHLPDILLLALPCLFEATVVAALARCLLEFPWHWGYVFGFAVSAASSSVNAEKLTQLKADGYGARELYKLILPTSTVENICSITAFTVTLTMALIGEAEWVVYVIKGPVAICLGLLFAASWGFISAMFPHRKDVDLVGKRSAMVLLGSLVVYVGAKEFELAPGGPLGTMSTGVAASFFWASQGWTEGKNPVLGVVSVIWDLLEAALFSYVGAEVDVHITTLKDILICAGIMAVSILVRLIVFYGLMALRKEFTAGEVLFATLIWFPKATVLAALSPQVLDNVRKTRGNPVYENTDEFRMARLVLLGSVIEMVVTTPIGHILVKWLGERLLPKERRIDKEQGFALTSRL